MKHYLLLILLALMVSVDMLAQSSHGRVISDVTKKTQYGGSVRTTKYSDGYVLLTTVCPCTYCSGSGHCSYCGGSGIGMFGTNCMMCYSSGQCQICHGTGSVIISTGSYPNSSSYGGSSSNSRSSSSSSSSSRRSLYTKCKYCNGTGVCQRCHGKGGSLEWVYNSQHWIDCGGCSGKGKCPICYGTGRL